MNLASLLPEFITIPPTSFLMGTPERDLSALAKAYGGTRESYREESPQFSLTLPAYEIAKTPVTNALYAVFVTATGARAPITWRGLQPPDDRRDHPVVDVSWDDANAFCQWLTQATTEHQPSTTITSRLSVAARRWSSMFGGRPLGFRLPTEAEWEHAARGIDGRAFPWGNAWDAALANTREAGIGATTPVNTFTQAASPYGLVDMCGNVWEWTASLDKLYPYVPTDGRESAKASGRRILRGGCYANPYGYARCACRFRLLPNVRNEFLGFRLARSV